jgi:hypothetical protein
MTPEQNAKIQTTAERALDALADLHELTGSVPGLHNLPKQIGELTVLARRAKRGELKTYAELSAEKEASK